jgi:hypothetical protein
MISFLMGRCWLLEMVVEVLPRENICEDATPLDRSTAAGLLGSIWNVCFERAAVG